MQNHNNRGPDADVVGAVRVDVEAGVDLDDCEEGVEDAVLACGERGALCVRADVEVLVDGRWSGE